MSYPFIMQGNSITIVIGTTPFTLTKSSINYNKVIDAIKANDWETVKDVVDPVQVVVKYTNGFVRIEGESLYWKDTPFDNSIAKRMIAMLKDGFPVDPLVAFMNNLMFNPSFNSVNQLYGFLEKNNLPITSDGYFLAYKKVKDDYTDCHTGTMDNSVGKTVEMPRNMVDDVAGNTCSTGLHFCSQEYLKSFGGERVVILKINPADVVSIPSDYNNSKGRTCRYEVIGEVGVDVESTTAAFSQPVQDNANFTLSEH